MKAIWSEPSGFREIQPSRVEVTILDFIETDIEPGYMRHGSKRCVAAIVALADGRIRFAELPHLQYVH